MLDVATRAFASGLISAASMPLGAITSRFWRPSNSVIGALTAFGAGALLAATVLDLVASSVEEGHLAELVVGSVIGSLFFTIANSLVNQYGGFLRKSATAVAHIGRQQVQQFKDFLRDLGRIDVFRTLMPKHLQRLIEASLIASYSSGSIIYEPGSACESLYSVHRGEVQLLDPSREMQVFATLKPGDSFSRMAFFCGTPHGTSAVAGSDCEVLILPKEAFEDLLEISPELNRATQQVVQGAEVAQYLQERHHLSQEEVKDWADKAALAIQSEARIPDAIVIENNAAEFIRLARQLDRLPLFRFLPNEDIEMIANRLAFRRYEEGDTVFYQNEPARSLFILHSGVIALSDPQQSSRKLSLLQPRSVFGGWAFLTGSTHSVTAVATEAAGVWELRRIDFEEVLKQSAELREAVAQVIREQDVTGYLQRKQGFSADQSALWLQKAVQSLRVGRYLPDAGAMLAKVKEHGNAPIAIWVGLLIDGIPESLTIGAGELTSGGVSLSLLAGLFISNYPEALSSSDGMRQQGFSFRRILLLWSSVMLIQGGVAGLGSLLLAQAPESMISLIEAIGAGAILTVLAETMLPEAYERRGWMVGLSMLLGFLVIILIKAMN